MLPPGGAMGSPCPRTPCFLDHQMMDQYGQGRSPPMSRPFPPGGASPCPQMPCFPDQNPYGEGRKPPCSECGALPEPPCLQQPPPPMGGFYAPCVECGAIPNAPCLQPQGFGYPPPQQNTPCVECANIPNAPCAIGGSATEPEGNYQEIGASMGGNTLTIRVHKDKNKVEQIDPNSPPSESSSEGGCQCSPGKMGKKGRRQGQSFNMRPGVQQGREEVPFAFKMGKTGNPDGNVVVNPPVATAPDGTKFTEFSDPNKELFILRVGKKSEGADRKQNLELELCTPRGKVL